MNLKVIRINAIFPIEGDIDEFKKELARIDIPFSKTILRKELYEFNHCMSKKNAEDISYSLEFLNDDGIIVRELVHQINELMNEKKAKEFQITLEYK